MSSERINSYRELKVWQSAMKLAEDCYAVTRSFPREEAFGMTAQVRRAAVSVAANIAEGYGRDSRASYIHFLRTSQGSLKELETHLLLAERVGLALSAAIAPLLRQCHETGKMLRALIRSLQAAPDRQDRVD